MNTSLSYPGQTGQLSQALKKPELNKNGSTADIIKKSILSDSDSLSSSEDDSGIII